ncbi:hypothetical protein [Gluconacetobacter entanii]|nr:hypothetical protein [Gluconacetobacter entanii]MCW4585393.1 hypothetical protein [Gluconacetobacter entanii]
MVGTSGFAVAAQDRYGLPFMTGIVPAGRVPCILRGSKRRAG